MTTLMESIKQNTSSIKLTLDTVIHNGRKHP